MTEPTSRYPLAPVWVPVPPGAIARPSAKRPGVWYTFTPSTNVVRAYAKGAGELPVSNAVASAVRRVIFGLMRESGVRGLGRGGVVSP